MLESAEETTINVFVVGNDYNIRTGKVSKKDWDSMKLLSVLINGERIAGIKEGWNTEVSFAVFLSPEEAEGFIEAIKEMDRYKQQRVADEI